MSELREYSIKDIGRVVTGKTPSTQNSELWGKDISFLTPSDFDDYNKDIESTVRSISKKGAETLKGKVLPLNTVVVTCIGSQMGKVGVTKTPCVTNQQINSIVINDGFDPEYVYYVMRSKHELLRNLATGGSTMPILNKSDFEKIRLCLPSFETQREIAEILSSLDDKIELNNKINSELEKLAQTIYKQWFADFEFPDENGDPYKSSGGEMVDSELGMIPKGWRITDFCDLATVKYGKDHKKLADGEYPVYGSGGIMRYVDSYLYSKPSILIPRKGTLSNIMRVYDAFWSVDTMFYTEIVDEYFLNYLYYYILREKLSERNVGSAVPSMTAQIINSVKVIVPSKDVVEEFEEVLSDSFSKIRLNTKESQDLSVLRDLLIKKLIK